MRLQPQRPATRQRPVGPRLLRASLCCAGLLLGLGSGIAGMGGPESSPLRQAAQPPQTAAAPGTAAPASAMALPATAAAAGSTAAPTASLPATADPSPSVSLIAEASDPLRLVAAGAFPTGAAYAIVVENPGASPSGARGEITLADADGKPVAHAAFLLPYLAPRSRAGWVDTVPTGNATPLPRMTVELHALPPGDAGSGAIVVVSGTTSGAQPLATLLLTNHNAEPVSGARLSVVAFDTSGAVAGGGFRTAPELPPHLDTQLVVPLQTAAAPARVEAYLSFTAATRFGATH